MGNLGRGEEHGGGVRASRRAGAAADAGGGFHREIGVVFRDRNGVRLRRGTGARADESARLHDAIERGAIDDEVLDDREGADAERFDRDRRAILELAHVKLASGRRVRRTMRFAVNR